MHGSYKRSCVIMHDTAIQGFDSGPVTARNITRKSVLPNFARHVLSKSWVDRFHTNDFSVPEDYLYAHGIIRESNVARERAILYVTEEPTVYAQYRTIVWRKERKVYILVNTIIISQVIDHIVKKFNVSSLQIWNIESW